MTMTRNTLGALLLIASVWLVSSCERDPQLTTNGPAATRAACIALTAPLDGALSQPVQNTLAWSGCPDDTIQIQLATDSTFATLANSYTYRNTGTLVVNLSRYLQLYYWRARTVKNGSTTAWTSKRSFTTMPVPPSCVSLVSPANGATNIAPGNQILTWSSSCPAADSFEVVLSPSSTFAASTTNGAPIYSQTYRVRGTSYTVGVEMNGIYYWRVRPLNAGVSQAWSPTFRFDAVDNMTARLGVYNNMTMEGWFTQGRTPYRDVASDSIGSVTLLRSPNYFNVVEVRVNGYTNRTAYIPSSNNPDYYSIAPNPSFFYVNFAYGVTGDSIELTVPKYNPYYFFKVRGRR